MPSQQARPRVLVVGGGFAGLAAVRALEGSGAEILLVDRTNHHLFQPLLYQVATAALSPADIAAPIRSIFARRRDVAVLLDSLESVDLAARRARFASGPRDYDWLVLGCGATHLYHGHPEWQQAAPGLKTLDDALEMRRRLLLAFEHAEAAADPAARAALLTFVVVGGGATGVELAGAIKEIAVQSMPRDFRRIDTRQAKVVLIEGGESLLPALDRVLGEKARQALLELGVDVRLRQRVLRIDAAGVELAEGRIPAGAVFWAAGVQASAVTRALGVEVDRGGRVKVGSDLCIPGHPEVFVVGDAAAVLDPATGQSVPGVAPAAIQMGRYAGRRIRAALRDGETAARRPPFRYRDRGSLATIGKARAVADLGGRRFSGLTAWLLWSVVHVLMLVTFRNRVFVAFQWLWNYLTFGRGARLITGDGTGRETSADRSAAPDRE